MISIRFNATICSIALVFGVIANINTSHGQAEFFDTFDGGDDAWFVFDDEGTFDIVDGSYVATGNDANTRDLIGAIVNDFSFADVSAQIQVVGHGDVFLTVRNGEGLDGFIRGVTGDPPLAIAVFCGFPDSRLTEMRF